MKLLKFMGSIFINFKGLLGLYLFYFLIHVLTKDNTYDFINLIY